ncbi:MAG: hypothetical protein Q9208_008272 [Pyrenodesmia sp. 3 TL-2023]
MIRIVPVVACIAVLSPIFCAPLTPNAPVVTRNFLAKRSGGEPNTGEDDFPDIEPHPNDLDKVEGGFRDAVLLASHAIKYLTGSDNTIFLHYFNEGDKDNVKKVFETVLGTTIVPEDPRTGNDMLSTVLVQKNDPFIYCVGRTLAYFKNPDAGDPDDEGEYLVLCPNAFNKKGVNDIEGAENPADAKFYITCAELYANGHVSYLMNFLGATLLHEYLHYEAMIQPVFGKFIVDEDDEDGYGPVNVYTGGLLDRSKAITNADSYTYFALEAMWTERCPQNGGFNAPRAGIDDADPDCGFRSCVPGGSGLPPPEEQQCHGRSCIPAWSGLPHPEERQCHGVSGDMWVDHSDKALDAIKEFCAQTNSPVDYYPDTEDTMRLHLNNEVDPSKTITDHPDCVGVFQKQLLDGCDSDPVNNPHNYKFGGTYFAGDGWRFELEALATQVNTVDCDVSYKVVLDQFELRGKNLPDSKLGKDGEGLRDEVEGCGALTKWHFEWTPDDTVYEWFASGQLPIGTKACVGRALVSAGGSGEGGC